MIRAIFSILALVAAVGISASSGCGKSGSTVAPEVLAEHRATLVLAEEPEGAQTVLEVREALLGEPVEGHDHAEEQAHAEEHEHGHADEHAHADGHEHAHAEEQDHEHADEHAHAEHEHEHAHEAAAEAKPAGPIDVLMVGSVGGLANPWENTQPDFPFVKDEAVFFLGDLGEVAEMEAHGHTHAPGEECAFCAAHAAESSALLAMVRFKGENGKVLPIEARELFDLKEKDTVVIRGTAQIEGGMMIVDATGLYVRR